MKLEKLSDTQIRCTLSKEDLSQRQLHLSELAYGSEKAKELFRDMMQQASIELGFEADNIPLMIEAIPISNDCLVLVVTKVEDPDELDTRFSRFSKINMDDSFDEDFSDIDDTDFEEMDFLDDEDDIDMDDEPLPFSPSSDFDNADSDASTSSKERSAIDDALDLIAPFTQAIAQAKKEAMRKKKEMYAMANSNRVIVPAARAALDQFKMEAANEVGVNLKQGYNGDLTSKQAGSIGGQMVKKMIEAYENGMK